MGSVSRPGEDNRCFDRKWLLSLCCCAPVFWPRVGIGARLGPDGACRAGDDDGLNTR